MKASAQDGAFAWVVCFACFINLVIVGGFIYSGGIFFIVFKETFDATESQLALIPSLNLAFMHLICPFAGKLSEKFDGRVISMLGCIISTIGIATAAFAKKVIHIHLGFGVLVGLGLGVTLNIGASFINPYFNKYKRVASSLVMTGLGIGAMVFPPVITLFQDFYGWRGAMLMLAGMNAQVLVSSSLLRPYQSNHKHNGLKKDERSPYLKTDAKVKVALLDQLDQTAINRDEVIIQGARRSNCSKEFEQLTALFKNILYMSCWICTLLYVFPLLIIVIHFGNYTLTCGYSKVDVVSFYTVWGISNLISRPLTGLCAHLLKLNLVLYIKVTLIASGLLTLLLPFMYQKWMFYGYVILYQNLMTPCNILVTTIIMEYIPENQVPSAIGINFASTVPGAILGAPLAAWIYAYTGVYAHVFYFSGGLLIACGLLLVPAFCYIHRKKSQTNLHPS